MYAAKGALPKLMDVESFVVFNSILISVCEILFKRWKQIESIVM